MKQLTQDVYMIAFWGKSLNIFVIDTGEGLALVDTGLVTSVKGISDALAKAGRSMQDVRHILITHAHPDHVGGLAATQKLTTARTYAHRRDAFIIRGEQMPAGANRSELRGLAWLSSFVMAQMVSEPARVDIEVEEGVTLDAIIPGLQVVELIGHSYGHVGYWWPERRLLFGGDVLFHWPWGLRMPFAAPTPDWNAAKQSVRKVAEMDVDILCLAHGAPIVGGAAEKIRAFAAKLTD